MNKKRQISATVGAVVAAAAISACGAATPAASRSLSLAVNPSPFAKPSQPTIDTSGLTITISPSSGPAGTVVTINVEGCGDPSGGNHAVSYNDGIVGATSAENLARIHAIPMNSNGSALTGEFKVPPNAASTGIFEVQCGLADRQAIFTVTQ